MKLRKIELSNIRSHSHIIFEPENNGITAISGLNGSGKSTIVDSIAWALYGTKPAGVSKTSAIMKHGVDDKKGKFFVKIELETIDGVLRVTRRIVNNGKKVECDVELLEKNGTWRYIAGPGVSFADKEIKRRLNMDESGFLSAILVQQKQVDQLISAKPKDRAEVIEKLTGVSSLTEALSEAKINLRELKKTAERSSVDEKNLSKIVAEKNNLDEEYNKFSKKIVELKETTESLSSQEKEKREYLKNITENYNQRKDLLQRKQVLSARLIDKEAELEKETKEKERRRAKVSTLSLDVDIQETQKELESLEKTKDKYTRTLGILQNNLKNYNKEYSVKNNIIENSEEKDLDKLKESIEKESLNLKKYEKALTQLFTQKNNLFSEKEQFLNAIEVISNHNGICPTCLQKVDNVNTAIESLMERKDKKEKDIDNISQRYLKGETIVQETQKKIDLQKNVFEAFETIKNLKNNIDDANNEIAVVTANIITIDGKLKAIRRIFNNAKNYEDLQNEYKNSLRQCQLVSDTIESLNSNLNDIDSKLNDIKEVSEKTLNKYKLELEKIQNSYNSYREKLLELNGKVKVLEVQRENLESNIAIEKEKVLKYKELLKSIEIASHTVSVISEFRDNRIKNSNPLIEKYSSNLLNRFTDGKFVGLSLDESFNATVILADGTKRPVGLLSGGELSAAAMSLRIAISMLLNSGEQNLIVLDEVLVSQDSMRAEQILSTIKDVCHGQVIIIAHNNIVESISDKIVEL